MAIVAVAVVIFGYSFMKGHNIFDSSREFYAVYDNVDGLSPSASITISGKNVGAVSGINFLNKSGKIVVTMRVNSDFQFSKNSVAQIYSGGFIGGKSIKIIPNHKGGPAVSGDTLKSDKESGVIAHVTQNLKPIEEKFQEVLKGLDTLLKNVNQVFDKETRQDLKGSLSNLNSTMNHLNNSAAEIDQLLNRNGTTLDTTIHNLSNMAYNLNTLSDSLSQIKVKALMAKVNGVLSDFEAISTQLKEGEGTLGKLLNDEELYNNLDQASQQLEELLQDIKLHPKRYINVKFSIFGGKDKEIPYRKPENASN